MQIRRLSKGQPSFEKKGHYKGRRTRIITSSKGRRRRPQKQQQARRHQELVPDFMKVVILQYYTCGLCATDYLYYCYMLQRDYHGLLLRPLQKAAKGHHQTVDRSIVLGAFSCLHGHGVTKSVAKLQKLSSPPDLRQGH